MLLIELITDVVEVISLVLRRYVGGTLRSAKGDEIKERIIIFRDQAPITEKMKCYFIIRIFT